MGAAVKRKDYYRLTNGFMVHHVERTYYFLFVRRCIKLHSVNF